MPCCLNTIQVFFIDFQTHNDIFAVQESYECCIQIIVILVWIRRAVWGVRVVPLSFSRLQPSLDGGGCSFDTGSACAGGSEFTSLEWRLCIGLDGFNARACFWFFHTRLGSVQTRSATARLTPSSPSRVLQRTIWTAPHHRLVVVVTPDRFRTVARDLRRFDQERFVPLYWVRHR